MRIFDINELALVKTQRKFKDEKRLRFLIGDVREYDRLYAVTKDIDIIFHAAALKQVPTVESHPYEAVKTNIIGAYNVVKAAVARKVKNVIAISTDKAVKPVNAMGMTKALQERRKLDLIEKAELETATREMWAQLPQDYQWLKEWEYV